nr:transposon TX1 uncharacterized [Tanacetum cinerariifolium]
MTRKQENDALFWELRVSNEDYELKSDKIINGDNVVVALKDENGYWKMKEDDDDAVVGTRFRSSVDVLGLVVDSDVIGVGSSNLENAVRVNASDLENVAPVESHFLDCPITLEEIKRAVWDCGSSKAPGPDGFTFKFLKKHWDTLKQDIVSYVKDFELSAHIPRGCNSSFITHVPKVDDPLVIRDFRPISLIGSQHKIIAKILANRLSQVVSSVVSEAQMAYIKGRQITLQEKKALMTNEKSSLLEKSSSLNQFNDENRRRHLSSQ